MRESAIRRVIPGLSAFGKLYGSVGEGVHETVPDPIGEPAVFYKEGSEVGRRFEEELARQGLL